MIVSDGAAQHKSRIVREYLDSTDDAVQMALLPGYAPDLNPLEYLWAWLKRHALGPSGSAHIFEAPEFRGSTRAALSAAHN